MPGLQTRLPRTTQSLFQYGILLLLILWFLLTWQTWAHWGDATVDCGREAYVPSVLAEGKTLYKDVWYPYGPAAPYLNAALFRIFGTHLNVLYVAGAAAVLLYAFPLYWLANRFCPLPGALCLGFALVIQPFGPAIFSFPLPYSFAAVYGAACGALFLLLAVKAALDGNGGAMAGAGILASLALLMKPEYGSACYGALGVLILGRYLQHRRLRTMGREVLLILPGVLLSVGVVAWMISLRGADFITQENIMSWPGTHFMRTYGPLWLRKTGFSLAPHALRDGAKFVAIYLGFWAVVGALARYFGTRASRSQQLWLGTAGMGIAVLGATYLAVLRPETFKGLFLAVFLPQKAVAIVIVALPFLAWRYWRSKHSPQLLALLVVSCFAVLLAFRFLFELSVRGYSIYYNGPVLLALFILMTRIALPRLADWPTHPRRWAPVMLFVAVAFAVVSESWVYFAPRESTDVPLRTERGMMYMEPQKAEGYRKAIRVMRDAERRGEAVMVMPEDTMLYFLSGVSCPTRVCIFTPGVLAPGKMTDDLIGEMEERQVRYILRTNRRFGEYGVPEFGVDFDQPLGEHLRTHYQYVESLTPSVEKEARHGWDIALWERHQ